MEKEQRLIDANWILGEIEHDLGCYEIGNMEKGDALFVDLRDVVRMVCASPTVDAVEVVRCKDCKHCSLDLSGRDAHLCMRKEVGFIVRRKLDDFCSYGERRTNA
jgi:hypothetical protein